MLGISNGGNKSTLYSGKPVPRKFPVAWLALYDEVLANLPALWERYFEPRMTTFKKPDYYQRRTAILIKFCVRLIQQDRLSWLIFRKPRPTLARFDLVYLLAAFWTREQRHFQHREECLLELYHTVLLETRRERLQLGRFTGRLSADVDPDQLRASLGSDQRLGPRFTGVSQNELSIGRFRGLGLCRLVHIELSFERNYAV